MPRLPVLTAVLTALLVVLLPSLALAEPAAAAACAHPFESWECLRQQFVLLSLAALPVGLVAAILLVAVGLEDERASRKRVALAALGAFVVAFIASVPTGWLVAWLGGERIRLSHWIGLVLIVEAVYVGYVIHRLRR